tara:strand:+ start:149 stop:583 length:435 start_codon:yes stop_codon:yes gene_type:complete
VLIKKQYHFYAGHRNHELSGKCSSWHGHRYGITIVISPERTVAGITMLFADIDEVAEKIIKKYDHAMLISNQDPYFEAMVSMKDSDGNRMKVVVFDNQTSVENLAEKLYGELYLAGLPMDSILVKETDSSVVVYNHWDYKGETT